MVCLVSYVGRGMAGLRVN